MGFGWIFLGYFFMFSTALSMTGGFDFLPDAVGFLIMLHGLNIAYTHCARFSLAKNMCGFGVFISLFYAVYQLLTSFAILSVTAAAEIIFWVYTAFIVGFNVCLLLALSGVAFETGVQKVRRRAVTGFPLCGILLFGGRLLCRIGLAYPAAPGEKTANYLYAGGLIAEIMFVIYMLVTIFSCYMWICLEGDEDMPDTRRHRLPSPYEIYEKGKNKGGKK